MELLTGNSTLMFKATGSSENSKNIGRITDGPLRKFSEISRQRIVGRRVGQFSGLAVKCIAEPIEKTGISVVYLPRMEAPGIRPQSVMESIVQRHSLNFVLHKILSVHRFFVSTSALLFPFFYSWLMQINPDRRKVVRR